MQSVTSGSTSEQTDAHILLASMYTDRKQWRDALKHTDLAVVKARPPKESWLQLKLALHNELREFQRCAEVLVHLIAMARSVRATATAGRTAATSS